jgi:hypothetical protein
MRPPHLLQPLQELRVRQTALLSPVCRDPFGWSLTDPKSRRN